MKAQPMEKIKKKFLVRIQEVRRWMKKRMTIKSNHSQKMRTKWMKSRDQRKVTKKEMQLTKSKQINKLLSKMNKKIRKSNGQEKQIKRLMEELI